MGPIATNAGKKRCSMGLTGCFLWLSSCFSGGGDGTSLVPKAHEAGAGAFELTERNAPSSFLDLFLLLTIIILPPLLAGSSMAQDFDHGHRHFDNVLKQFVDSGRVDYAGLKVDNAALDRYLSDAASISEKHFKSWNEPRRLAFLFNLYNAATLKLILAHYPVKSIKDIGTLFKGPWDQRVVRLFGNVITLDELEHGILRKQYNEPRLHLALVCAAKGCPPLRSEAYTAERLDEQLEDQAKRFLGNPASFQIDRENKVVYLSSIFKWYGVDFRANYAPANGFSGLNETHRAVSNFSARYLSDRDRKYLEAGGYTVKFLDYDWSLNDRKEVR
jgi:hypothetical protein